MSPVLNSHSKWPAMIWAVKIAPTELINVLSLPCLLHRSCFVRFSMPILRKSSRNGAIAQGPLGDCICATTLLVCSALLAAVIAVTSVTTLAKAETVAPPAPGYATSPSDLKHRVNRDGNNYDRYRETPVYFGNWGFAPGGYYWNPDYMWRRSRGFWDTNTPACPFRSC